jgi:hypothetical protein
MKINFVILAKLKKIILNYWLCESHRHDFYSLLSRIPFLPLDPARYYSNSVIHSIGMGRMRIFLAVLRSFFHSCLLYTLSCHPSPSTVLPSSLTSFCHLFRGLPLGLVVSKFIHNTLLGILCSSILCTCPNQRNLCSFIVSGMRGY